MNNSDFEKILFGISAFPIFVLDTSIPLKKYVKLDMSTTNKDLLNFDVSSAGEWEKYIDSYLEKKAATVAYGGYLEERNLYNRSTYFTNQSKENQRNIHLGMDFWCKENTKVLAALDGTIHSFKLNDNYGDYGPTIILKHQIQGQLFYTLYGHLTLNSIKNIKVGTPVKQGEVIGSLGSAAVNGDYAPHLHFQIIKDIEGNFGDYPGVSSLNNLAFYKENCPDPKLLLCIKNA